MSQLLSYLSFMSCCFISSFNSDPNFRRRFVRVLFLAYVTSVQCLNLNMRTGTRRGGKEEQLKKEYCTQFLPLISTTPVLSPVCGGGTAMIDC